jgi:hypothetical protein
MLAPITTACSPIRFMMHPALVAGVKSLRFRWYGVKAGSVLLRRRFGNHEFVSALKVSSSDR